MPDRLPFERPLGATPGGIRVWAPKAGEVAVRLGKDDHALESEGLGVWSASHMSMRRIFSLVASHSPRLQRDFCFSSCFLTMNV